MNVKKYNNTEHYSILLEWFKGHNVKVCPPESISKNAYIVYNKETPIAFSFFVSTDTCVAGMGFTITNPGSSKEMRISALDILIPHIFKESKVKGYKFLHYYTDRNPMVSHMVKHGMTITDNGDAFILMKSLSDENFEFYYI